MVDRMAAVLRPGAMPQQVVDAASVIEQAGFTVIDDLLDGYGVGYLPPVLGARSRPNAHIPAEPFHAGMTVVIQPNVVTIDGRARRTGPDHRHRYRLAPRHSPRL